MAATEKSADSGASGQTQEGQAERSQDPEAINKSKRPNSVTAAPAGSARDLLRAFEGVEFELLDCVEKLRQLRSALECEASRIMEDASNRLTETRTDAANPYATAELIWSVPLQDLCWAKNLQEVKDWLDEHDLETQFRQILAQPEVTEEMVEACVAAMLECDAAHVRRADTNEIFSTDFNVLARVGLKAALGARKR
jgi:hypothetical protein